MAEHDQAPEKELEQAIQEFRELKERIKGGLSERSGTSAGHDLPEQREEQSEE